MGALEAVGDEIWRWGNLHANNAAPLSVNFRYVPLSCRHSYPSAMPRSMPARKSSPLPPAARNGALTRSI
jgi:hypothetical protein